MCIRDSKESCESHPGKLLAYTVNVTSQCEKEQHIKYLEEYNRKIIEALPEFIFIFDDNFFITDVLMAPGTILLHPEQMDDLFIHRRLATCLFVTLGNVCVMVS